MGVCICIICKCYYVNMYIFFIFIQHFLEELTLQIFPSMSSESTNSPKRLRRLSRWKMSYKNVLQYYTIIIININPNRMHGREITCFTRRKIYIRTFYIFSYLKVQQQYFQQQSKCCKSYNKKQKQKSEATTAIVTQHVLPLIWPSSMSAYKQQRVWVSVCSFARHMPSSKRSGGGGLAKGCLVVKRRAVGHGFVDITKIERIENEISYVIFVLYTYIHIHII